jgi:hypothetical protein
MEENSNNNSNNSTNYTLRELRNIVISIPQQHSSSININHNDRITLDEELAWRIHFELNNMNEEENETELEDINNNDTMNNNNNVNNNSNRTVNISYDQLRELFPSTFSGFCSRGTVGEIIWFVVVNCILIVALIIDRHKECDGYHLKKWALLQIGLQTLMIITSIFLQWKMPRENQTQQLSQQRLQTIASFYVLNRFLNIMWVIWVVLGIVWTFQSKDCADSLKILYPVCYFLSITHIIILGLPIITCCCSIPLILFIYCCCPSYLGNKQSKKASMKLIKKTTTLKTYNKDLIPKEDSSCAICLSDYENGEQLRFLHCGHHFHDKCIVQWLLNNKTCPFCKKEIDQKDQEIKKNNSEDTNHLNNQITPLIHENENRITMSENLNTN